VTGVSDADIETVRAGGGVVWRVNHGAVEVFLVHRPKYDDWSIPKGKVEPGETEEQAAVREVEEETGFRCTLGRELTGTAYIDRKGRPKTVRYWEMTVAGGTFAPSDEVDVARWYRLPAAARRLSYVHDVGVLESFATFAGV
jgi:8-oxo-dGTP diphosphatase